jgi:hypothetical protein
MFFFVQALLNFLRLYPFLANEDKIPGNGSYWEMSFIPKRCEKKMFFQEISPYNLSMLTVEYVSNSFSF